MCRKMGLCTVAQSHLVLEHRYCTYFCLSLKGALKSQPCLLTLSGGSLQGVTHAFKFSFGQFFNEKYSSYKLRHLMFLFSSSVLLKQLRL